MKVFFGTRLRTLRGSLSQTEMANKLGTNQTTYSAWERGERELNITTICAISKLFGVTADWLLGISDVRDPSLTMPPAGLSVSDPVAAPYGAAPCAGCLARDARLDKLLDVMHRGSAAPAASVTREVPEREGRVLPAGAVSPGR
jgi:transcriptional regulator with XRE-family HTH domain